MASRRTDGEVDTAKRRAAEDEEDEAGSLREKNSSSRSQEEEAFVTMITSDDFVMGAEVMLHSLREHSRVRRPQVAMVTLGVSQTKRQALAALADEIIEVR